MYDFLSFVRDTGVEMKGLLEGYRENISRLQKQYKKQEQIFDRLDRKNTCYEENAIKILSEMKWIRDRILVLEDVVSDISGAEKEDSETVLPQI